MKPTQKVRDLTYRRDGRCLMCGALAPLEWNHRANSGMGGSKYKPTPADGVMLCSYHNQGIESDAKMQADALYWGYKVRRFCPVPVADVPVYDRWRGLWFLLDAFGARDRLTTQDATDLRLLAGILPDTAEGAMG